MKTVLRAVVTILALVSVALAGAGEAHAADPTTRPPDLIGGALTATPTGVTLTSKSTVPASVVITTDGPFTLTPTEFTIDPGETVTMTVTGDARGKIAASMFVLAPSVGGETSSVTLEVAFPKPTPPAFPWPLVVALAVVALVALGGFYGVKRVARRYRLVRVDR
jgi:hypothetical protein